MATKWEFFLLALGLVSVVALAQRDERELTEAAWEGDKLIHRLEALDALLSAADFEQRIEILGDVESMLAAARSSEVESCSTVEATRRVQGVHIVHHFIDTCTGFLAESPEGKRELIAMMLRVCATKDPQLAGETYGLVYERLMELAESDEQRTEYALGFVELENHPVGWRAAHMLNERRVLEDSTLRRVRAICRDSLANGHANSLVLEVLGHHGDQEILGELKMHIDKLVDDAESVRVLRNAIMHIEAQHPPTRLLDDLRSASAGAAWRAARAMQLGLPRDELRTAVLEYYTRCPKDQLQGFRMMELKEVVIENGIVSENELPTE